MNGMPRSSWLWPLPSLFFVAFGRSAAAQHRPSNYYDYRNDGGGGRDHLYPSTTMTLHNNIFIVVNAYVIQSWTCVLYTRWCSTKKVARVFHDKFFTMHTAFLFCHKVENNQKSYVLMKIYWIQMVAVYLGRETVFFAITTSRRRFIWTFKWNKSENKNDRLPVPNVLGWEQRYVNKMEIRISMKKLKIYRENDCSAEQYGASCIMRPSYYKGTVVYSRAYRPVV